MVASQRKETDHQISLYVREFQTQTDHVAILNRKQYMSEKRRYLGGDTPQRQLFDNSAKES